MFLRAVLSGAAEALLEKTFFQAVLQRTVQQKVENEHAQGSQQKRIAAPFDDGGNQHGAPKRHGGHDQRRGGRQKRKRVAGIISKGGSVLRIHKEKRGAEENEKGIAQHGEEGEVVAVIFCAAEADSQRVLKKDAACRRQRYGQTKAHASQYKQRQTLFQALCGCGEYDNGPEKGVGNGHACGQTPKSTTAAEFFRRA